MRCSRCKRWEVPCRECRRVMLGLPGSRIPPKFGTTYRDALGQTAEVTDFGADWVRYRYTDEGRQHEMDRLEFATSFKEEP